MSELVIIILAFIPPLVLAVDVLVVFLKRRDGVPTDPSAPLQMWLQDFFFVVLGFVGAMTWNFDRVNWTSAIFPVLSVGFGFLAAMDVCSSRACAPQLTARERALPFAGLILVFIFSIWAGLSMWFLWKRLEGLLGTRWRCVDRTSCLFAALATLIYAIAFFLPMNKHDAMGYTAYMICVSFSEKKLDAGELPVTALAWTANPCFWLSTAFLMEGRRGMAAALAASAALLAWPISISGEFTVLNSMGYGVWFGSMILLFVLALVSMNQRVTKAFN